MAVIFMGADKTKAGSTNRIEFNETEIVASNGYIMRTKAQVTRNEASHENPDPRSLGGFQDTGPSRAIITIVGEITSALEEGNVVRGKIKSFVFRNQTPDGFPYGTFGFELDSHPEYNLNPSTIRGAAIIDHDIEHSFDKKSVTYFTIVARVFGDFGEAPEFDWRK